MSTNSEQKNRTTDPWQQPGVQGIEGRHLPVVASPSACSVVQSLLSPPPSPSLFSIAVLHRGPLLQYTFTFTFTSSHKRDRIVFKYRVNFNCHYYQLGIPFACFGLYFVHHILSIMLNE
ncbi:hypothetical protein P152DRAFT_130313 [Eremomyces bilateralis CBS 781.70]|uniref:Uncharacterized protein n=1 Tax=Eremomyces bilateralis CBS 781.70 TaxID=1392243 RepID=A0A6G1GFG4_9PEZI|nr:uncharacterized protein P152DRAFT_130313 [Eremomyces bilateralis CBS 781.70]KAF1816619.1 hypothetical protein P152DRAFT_130313 [Eremomyces bilateralis CBS 781.70]